MENKETTKITIPDPGTALRPLHKQTKFTRKKKLAVLEELGKEFNVSAAAAKLNIPRQSIIYLLNNDEQFKEAFEAVRDGWLDHAEGSGFQVAIQPSREGYNDRKLMLQAYRQERYAQKPEVQFNQQINITSGDEVHSLINRIKPDKS